MIKNEEITDAGHGSIVWNNTATAIHNSDQGFFVGTLSDAQNYINFFDGSIDDLAIINRNLTTDEIDELALETPSPEMNITKINYNADGGSYWTTNTTGETLYTYTPQGTYLSGDCSTAGSQIVWQKSNLPFYITPENAWNQSPTSACYYSTYYQKNIFELRVPASFGYNNFCVAEIDNWDNLDQNGSFTASSTFDYLGTYDCANWYFNLPTTTFTTSSIEWDSWFATGTASSSANLTAHSLACSTEDWEDTAWWVELRCQSVETLFFAFYK